MDRVNVILAAYNGEKYIGEQIGSILDNTFWNLRLWIFDDGSGDKTETVIDVYRMKYPDKIIFRRNPVNKGVTLNFLDGMRYAAGFGEAAEGGRTDTAENESQKIREYFMFSDQDDVWMPDKIEKTLRYMKKLESRYGSNSAAAVFTDARVVDENLKTIYPSFYESGRLDTGERDLPHIMMENKLIGCTVMVNRELAGRLKQLPEKARFHDWWVAMIAAAFGHIGYLPEATLYYRQHGGNMVGNQSFSSYVRNRISSIKKQKEALHAIVSQAGEFYRIFHTELPAPQKKQVYILAQLEKKNWFERRLLIVKYGYLKTGLLRNIGLLCLI